VTVAINFFSARKTLGAKKSVTIYAVVKTFAVTKSFSASNSVNSDSPHSPPEEEYSWPELEGLAARNGVSLTGFPGTGPKDRAAKKIADLIDRLDKAQLHWDLAFTDVLTDGEARGLKLTEEKLRIATRNELRLRTQEIPEIVRWKLRAALGGIEQHE